MMKVTLQCADGEMEVDMAVATQSRLIADMLKDDVEGEKATIPLAGVSIATLTTVVAWCTHHVGNPLPKIARPIKSAEMKEVMKESPWDAEFIAIEDQEKLFELILAANYLDVEPLLDLGCAKLATILKARTPKEIREHFGIGEPTPEQEDQVRKDNEWIFDVKPAPADAPVPAAVAAT